MGTAKAVLRGKYMQYKHHPKTGKNSNTKANLAPKEAREKKANRSYTQQKERVNKDSRRTQRNLDQKNCGTDQQNQELVL